MDGLLHNNMSIIPQSFFIFLRGADHPEAGGPSPRSGWPVGGAGEDCSVSTKTGPKFSPHLCIWVTVVGPLASMSLCFLFCKMGDKYLLAKVSASIENARHIADEINVNLKIIETYVAPPASRDLPQSKSSLKFSSRATSRETPFPESR